ncbi:MAG: helix-turn-helix domain-containing protein [Nanoarchaeota archaeon]|nr:hypothetical protein [Nanoarchaeota archaeon]
MILNQELIKKIRNYFNLNIYETKVWLALLSKGIASAGEIAEISGVPRSRTYDVLEGLEKQGFVISKVGKPARFIVVKPTVVLDKLKNNELEKTKDKLKVLNNLKTTPEYAELESLHNSSVNQLKIEEISGAVKGKSNIFSHLRSIFDSAEKEILICMSAKELFEKKRIFKKLFEGINKEKINMKFALNGEDSEIKKVTKIYDIKAKKTNIISKFFLIDKKQMFFSLNPQDNEEELAVWINSEFFSSAIAGMFNQAHR